MRGDRYQIALILLGVAVTALLGYFVYQELFPEYRIYQNDYIALEEFRSSYTHETPPAFSTGVKQIVFEREDKGPANVDRCVSCHVALQLPHFSPSKIDYDAEGNVIRDAQGKPVLSRNENYVWARLDEKIKALTDTKVNEQLEQEGASSKVRDRLDEAGRLSALKIATVGDQEYDIEKVLVMHPLIGKETRAFEFHPIDDYGCTICHSGNGRGLTTEKAHGPVFDGHYEIESEGPKPMFTEIDRANDPLFSRVFNNKPSDSLLFQTTPILVGNLIQSSCVQCHIQNGVSTVSSANHLSKHQQKINAATESLTGNFHRGEQLFLSQACYACHKISGHSRGGIGPELTRAGFSYPWYLKESIVWPQADLRTSTMPNFKLDHVELEDLMTYLLAQKGPTKAVSPMGYKLDIQEWEAGRKTPWEQPIPPSDIHNLRYSMTIFATQGCAACHRLEGYDSTVGYAIEKRDEPSYDDLEKKHQWFRKLFQEEIRGTAIEIAIEEHANEIDQNIVDGVRKDGLLEAIDAQYPGTIDSFYSDFHYAARAKDAYYRSMEDKAHGDIEKQKIRDEANAWNRRVHDVLMIYIQEYGLGRMIGPSLNWAGVYRSDEWLMEHFHNPGGHSPRSIMPVMPFDDSKFYALTYMLDVLGRRNRDAVHAIWNHQGFIPEQAYQIYCSQCHGNFLQGNGPVAAWIYPVPKNLQNGDFLRNLTKENAIRSITHGVKGTPMAPWGEAATDKEGYDGEPVLTQEEITKLADWLYRSISATTPGNRMDDVPKYRYMPKDIIDDLKREKSLLDGDVFTVKPHPIASSDGNAYYIKSEFYTQENIEKGKQFFAVNCSYCHGADADGAGIRAGIMIDAKPRMLTNIDWLRTVDDLKLLRSIKYGVPGTAMTPWGDFTSAQQRIELVVYIRSLSIEKERRNAFAETLYQVFSNNGLQVEAARIAFYPQLADLERQLGVIQGEKDSAESDQKALSLYEQELKLQKQLKSLKAQDQQFLELRKSIAKDELAYSNLGNAFLSADIDSEIWQKYLKLVNLNGNHYVYQNDKLLVNNVDNKQIKELVDQIDKSLEGKITKLQNERFLLLGRFPSVERETEIRGLDAKIATLTKLKKSIEGIWRM